MEPEGLAMEGLVLETKGPETMEQSNEAEKASVEPGGRGDGPKSGGESQTKSSEGEEEVGPVRVEENQPGSLGSGRTELADVKDDALFEVLKRLDFRSLSAVEATCRRFRRLATHKTVYKGIGLIQIHIYAPGMTELKVGESGRLTKLKHWEKLHALACHLTKRGARPAVVMLGVKSMAALDQDTHVAAAVTQLKPRTLDIYSPDVSLFLCNLMDEVLLHCRLECLVMTTESHGLYNEQNKTPQAAVSAALALAKTKENQAYVRNLLRPAALPRLKCLALMGPAWAEKADGATIPLPWDPENTQKALRLAWEDSQLLCFRTPLLGRSFLKGPKDQSPHPDFFRVVQRSTWKAP